MTRVQIKSIYLYSHHGERISVDFDPSSVNILVGVSYTGKSSLIEIIDYCLGATECHIPGVVREASSWVGVHWQNGRSEILVLRRIPSPSKQSSEEVFFAVGAPIAIPGNASQITPNTNRDGGLRQFEQCLYLGEVDGETFTDREGVRISLRNATPYLFQSDDVIINKSTLLRGTNDERRISIADSLPYFLGAVDESTARAEAKLKQLKSRIEKETRKADAAERLIGQERDRSLSLLSEAAQLQMIEPVESNASQDQITESLLKVSGWTNSPSTFGEEDQLNDLYRQEQELRQKYAVLRRQLSDADFAIESATNYSGTVQRQTSKLDVVSFFRPSARSQSCPLCESQLSEKTAQLSAVDSALAQLKRELADVEIDRPKIDKFVMRTSEDLRNIGEQLEIVRARIAAVIRESEDTADRLSQDDRRLRVSGRVSYYLEDRLNAGIAVDRSGIEKLQSELEELEKIANPEAKAERIDALQSQVSIYASALLKRLPFDPNYRDSQIAFNVRGLSIRFILGPRLMQMRDIGGDESYLSGHVATLLALHRVFAEGNRPVPGVIIFDQLSRPFFPADKFQGEVEVKNDDRSDLKQYFDVLFDEVELQKSLQVIVLEHALFADDARYSSAVKRRWNSESRLIPADWPRVIE